MALEVLPTCLGGVPMEYAKTDPAMAFPSHKVAAGGDLYGGLAQVGIAVVADLSNDFRRTSNEAWQWQRSATEAGAYSDIPAAEGGTSTPYTPSAGDLGRWLKATVTYDDATGTGWTAEETTQVLSRPTLSNAGYTHRNLIGYIYGRAVTHKYAQPFTTGSHTRGYLLKGLRLSLFVDEEESADGTWAVHTNDAGKPAADPLSAALPILDADLDDEIDTFEELTHPDGVHLDPDTKYWIVISQTTPNTNGNIGIGALSEWDRGLAAGLATPPVDTGSEDGWSVDFQALSYFWDDPDDDDGPVDPEGNPINPELLLWQLLAKAVEVPGRIVLRISLLAPVELPEVTVEFGASDYAVTEGRIQSVTVTLSADPERTVIIPIETTGWAGLPTLTIRGCPKPSPSTRGKRPSPSPSVPSTTPWTTTKA